MVSKKIAIFLFITITFIFTLSGQEKITHTGIVQDSIGKPLEFANIIVFKKNSAAIATYAITDDLGKFQLSIFKDSLYTLKISYVGFNEKNEQISFKEDTFKKYALKEANALDAVTIVHEMPIKVSGDTISYKVDAFTTGKERKLKDVVEKLPGFEVDDEGNVKVQGKKVSKIMVDGKEFFSGDTKLAMKNIPANVIDKINVLKNFNDIQPLKGLTNNEMLVVDVRLKADKKNIIFGSVEGGGGFQDRYLAHTNIFYYNPKISLNFIGDINNVGIQGLTFQDYFKFNGGIAGAGKRGESSLRLSSDLLGLSALQDNQAQQNTSKLGALNYAFNPTKKLSFSGFLIHSKVDYDIKSEVLRTYISESENTSEQLTSNSDQGSSSTIVKLTSKYIPNSKTHIAYDAFFKTNRLEDTQQQLSSFGNITNNINSNNDKKPLSFEQSISAYFTKNERNVFSLEVAHKYDEKDNMLELLLTNQSFGNIIPLTNTTLYNIFQDSYFKTNLFSATFNHYYVLNRTNHLNFYGGAYREDQRLNSAISERVNDSETQFSDSALLNDVDYKFLDVFGGASFRSKINKLTLDFGLAFHSYNLNNTQLNVETKFDKFLVLPSFRAKYDIKKSRTLSLDYAIKAEFANIQDLAQGYILQDYNNIYSGNPFLENAWFHDVNFNYFDFNAYNYTNIYVVFNYRKKYKEISNTLIFEDITSISSPINLNVQNELFTGYFNYDRRFKKFKIKASADLSYLLFNNISNQVLIENISFTQRYRTSLETNIDDFPILEIGFEKVLNNYKSSVFQTQTFTVDRPFVNLEVSFLKNFILTSDYEFNFYKSKEANTESKFDFLNAYLYYQAKDSPFEFKFSALNILNTKSLRRDSFSGNFSNTSQYFVQPQFFLLSLKYEF